MLTIYDPTTRDALGKVRGGGRVLQILRENLKNSARFVSKPELVGPEDTFLNPIWHAFKQPPIVKKIASKQILVVFDVIPLKYPQAFPIGLRGRWWLLNNLRALKSYDTIITISEAAKEDIVEYLNVPAEKVIVVYITTRKLFFEKKMKKSKTAVWASHDLPNKPFCLYVGDTNWNKNLVNMAQAIIKKGVPCVCVGRAFSLIDELRLMDTETQRDTLAESKLLNHPEQHEFKEFIKLVLHDKNFYFPGYIDDDELKLLYHEASCNLLVSKDEGFGLSYLEAATQACPSVLGDIPVFHEIAGKTALFADPDDINDIAAKIHVCMKGARGASGLGERARKHVFTAFSPEKFARKMRSGFPEV